MLAAGRGSIVNIASLHADLTSAGMFPYAAAKSGLVGLTRSLALEVGPRQVRVNALSPGYTETPLAKEWFRAQPAEKRQEVLAVHPMGRMASPMEIANCVAFLLSSGSLVRDRRELARRRRPRRTLRVDRNRAGESIEGHPNFTQGSRRGLT